jgi:hypothetical protein
MRFFTAAAAGAVLALAACVDVDMDTTILDADRVRVSGHIQMERAMFDMAGGGTDGFCPEDEGGTLTLTDQHARCTITQTGTFAEIFEAAAGGIVDDADEETPMPTATDVGDGTVRVVFPLGDIAGEAEAMGADPGMVAMFRPMMEGHSIILRISGAEIVSSNGKISPDRTSSVLTIPLTDLLDGPQAIPASFEAVVRY